MSRNQHFALYVHLPFCVRKCRYCAFASSELKRPEDADVVLRSILGEARRYAAQPPWNGLSVHSLFLGGGTPSTLYGRQINDLVRNLKQIFPFTSDAECTVEVNPGTLTGERMEGWEKAGLNRVSLGVQSLDPAVLKRLGRIHSADQARSAWKRLSEAGFARLSLDLMYGVDAPDPVEGWTRTLDEVLSWHPGHVSAYSLIVEPGTPFAVEVEDGGRVKTTEEVELEQYVLVRDRFAEAGLEHYEVSNWARPGERCRHNISYWDGGSYLALGPSGHSYDAVEQRRFWNWADTFAWLGAVEMNGTGVEGAETLTAMQRFEERVSLGLRMVEGIEEDALALQAAEAGTDWPPPVLESLIKQGFLIRDNGVLRYTDRGLLIADELEARLTA